MVRLSDEDYSVLEIRASEMRLPVAMLARSILHRELVQELGAVLADVAADIPVAVPEAPLRQRRQVLARIVGEDGLALSLIHNSEPTRPY